MRESVRNKLIELGVLNIEEYIDGDTKNMKMRCEQCNTVTSHTFRQLKKARQTALCQSCIRFNNTVDELKSFGILNIKEFKDRDTKNLKVGCKTCSIIYTTSLHLLRVAKYPQKCGSCVAKVSKRATSLSSIGSTDCLNKSEYINTHTHNLEFMCSGCKVNKFTCSLANLTKHSGKCSKCSGGGVSNLEKQVSDFISNYISIETSNRTIIKPLELDIVIPSKQLAIEFNGIYWHSDSMGKDINYHLNKTKSCNDKSYNLLHIFENEWINKPDIIKSIILNKIGKTPTRIYARNTEVREVLSTEATRFLNDNHRQGSVNSSINIGLYHEDILVALMTFSKSRFGSEDYELLRYCNKIYTSVVGGASKLLKYFRNNHDGSIVTYADLRYSTGNMYDTLGFTFSHNSKPNYWYFKPSDTSVLFSRLKFQKHKQQKILSKFDKNKTEYENMLDNGYNRIWDCGNAVYKLS